MYQKYPVKLTEAERDQLKQVLAAGISRARKIRRVQVLLKSDSSLGGPNWSYDKICEAFNVSERTISDVRQAYFESGLEVAINRKRPRRVYVHRLDGEAEAHLLALACGEPPEGRERWSLRLLKSQMIKLGYVENVSPETVRTTLKKMNLSLG
jgi:transposase